MTDARDILRDLTAEVFNGHAVATLEVEERFPDCFVVQLVCSCSMAFRDGPGSDVVDAADAWWREHSGAGPRRHPDPPADGGLFALTRDVRELVRRAMAAGMPEGREGICAWCGACPEGCSSTDSTHLNGHTAHTATCPWPVLAKLLEMAP